MIHLSLFLLLTMAQSYRSRYPIVSDQVPASWGVNIHFTDEQPGELNELSKVFRWARMDFAWEGIERRKGEYDFSAYDRLLSGLDARRVRPYFILDYGNNLYRQGSPTTPESIEAFCKFVSASIHHFRHRGIVWEMWNEPNIGFWKPKPNVDQYIALATAVGKTIRSETPDEWFIGPATSGFDWNFIQATFKAGLLNYWDAVSVHPYRQSNPETVVDDWEKLRGLIAASTAPKLPVLSGEWGYSDVWGGFNEQLQAKYMVREYLANLACGVPVSIYYDWKNDGTNPTDSESHFGTVNVDLSPKPAYASAEALLRQLDGYRFVRRISGLSKSAWVLVFRKGSQTKMVAWTTASTRTESIQLNGRTFPLTDFAIVIS